MFCIFGKVYVSLFTLVFGCEILTHLWNHVRLGNNELTFHGKSVFLWLFRFSLQWNASFKTVIELIKSGPWLCSLTWKFGAQDFLDFFVFLFTICKRGAVLGQVHLHENREVYCFCLSFNCYLNMCCFKKRGFHRNVDQLKLTFFLGGTVCVFGSRCAELFFCWVLIKPWDCCVVSAGSVWQDTIIPRHRQQQLWGGAALGDSWRTCQSDTSQR